MKSNRAFVIVVALMAAPVVWILFQWLSEHGHEEKTLGIELSNLDSSIIAANIGMELLEGLDSYNDRVPTTEGGSIARVTLPELVSAIKDRTDYDATVCDEWLLVFPKHSPEHHDKPLVLRKCRIDPAVIDDHASPLSIVQPSTVDEPVGLTPTLVYRDPGHPPSIRRFRAVGNKTMRVADLLIQVSRMDGVKGWSITHFIMTDASGKVLLPHKLGFGLVYFNR